MPSFFRAIWRTWENLPGLDGVQAHPGWEDGRCNVRLTLNPAPNPSEYGRVAQAVDCMARRAFRSLGGIAAQARTVQAPGYTIHRRPEPMTDRSPLDDLPTCKSLRYARPAQ